MKRTIITIALAALLAPATLWAQDVKLDSVGRDAQYVESIIGRSQKIVDGLNLVCAKDGGQLKPCCQNKLTSVRNIISNRYFLLNDIYEKYPKGTVECNAELYKHHFELAANLANYLTEEQIEAVKDGMTFGVVPKTYQAHLDMIPTLKESEKLQILNWLKEAREFAIDAPDSKSKHEWFGKYKGRINNWLSGRGYDLVKEREGWYQRIEAEKQTKK